jgi:predicted Zn-dependent protease
VDLYDFYPRLERARVRQTLEDHDAALDDARFALAARPEDPRALLVYARALIELDRPDEALPVLSDLAESSFVEQDPDVFLALAQAQAALGKLDTAIATVGRYVEARLGDPSGWYLLGAYKQMAGRDDEARMAFENQRRATGNAAIGRHAAALRAERAGHVDAAIELLESLAKDMPDYRSAAADLERLKRGR